MIIQKIVAPSHLQQEPFNTIWIADLESGKEIWVQTNDDQSRPKWLRLGDIYEEVWLNMPSEIISSSIISLITNLRTIKDEQKAN